MVVLYQYQCQKHVKILALIIIVFCKNKVYPKVRVQLIDKNIYHGHNTLNV